MPISSSSARGWRRSCPRRELAGDLVAKLYAQSDPARWSLQDRGYIAKVHPLELWLLAHLREHPRATLAEVLDASRGERLDSYRWLFRSGHRGAQNRRIRTLLEREAFRRIHAQWQATGYPFPSLVPSLATALGTSADRPTALAELMGIIASDGVRVPLRRIEAMRFAADTPYETHVAPTPSGPDRVLRPEVCAVVQRALCVHGRGRHRRARARRAAPRRWLAREGRRQDRHGRSPLQGDGARPARPRGAARLALGDVRVPDRRPLLRRAHGGGHRARGGPLPLHELAAGADLHRADARGAARARDRAPRATRRRSALARDQRLVR